MRTDIGNPFMAFLNFVRLGAMVDLHLTVLTQLDGPTSGTWAYKREVEATGVSMVLRKAANMVSVWLMDVFCGGFQRLRWDLYGATSLGYGDIAGLWEISVGAAVEIDRGHLASSIIQNVIRYRRENN
jgi:hypothetical protein